MLAHSYMLFVFEIFLIVIFLIMRCFPNFTWRLDYKTCIAIVFFNAKLCTTDVHFVCSSFSDAFAEIFQPIINMVVCLPADGCGLRMLLLQ